MGDATALRPAGAIPAGAKLVQLREGRKQPATAQGHLAGVLSSDFVPLGRNVGIVLDEALLAIDLDKPHLPQAAQLLTRLTADGLHGATWEQRTPRQHATELERRRAPHGTHWLFRTPPGWRGSNKPLVIDGVQVGEIKTLGYIVAPGSEIVCDDGQRRIYELACAAEPLPAPEWALRLAQGPQGPQKPPEGPSGVERERIVDGERDNELIAIAGFLRRRGFSQEAITAMLAGVIDSGVLEQPPGREVEAGDVARIARSAARYAIGPADVHVLPSAWRTGDDVPEHPEPVAWILPGYVPAVGLTVLYGDGKIGKSTWAAWLAARVTRAGGTVVYIGSGEETFEQFVSKVRRAGGGDVAQLIEYPPDQRFVLPSGVAQLAEGVTSLGNVQLVYVDALYSHFGSSAGLHAGERARAMLKPLAEMAQGLRLSVLGTVHENAAGGLLGSREIRNVARSLLHATRKDDGDFTLWSDGGNAWSPDYGLRFPGTAHPLRGSDGLPIVFEDVFGERIEQSVWTLTLGSKAHNDDDRYVVVEDILPTKSFSPLGESSSN